MAREKKDHITPVFGPGSYRIVFFLFLVALAAFVAGLFVHVTRDASKYAAIAREISETGDFINLKINGEPYIQKPPLLFWLSALSFSLFGISDFAFKLPVLLFSFAGIFFTYKLGKLVYGRDTGFIAAVLLGSSQIYFLYNMDIHTDTLLQTFVTFSLWQLYGFLRTGRNRHILLGFAGIGMAMLTKGPVGAVVPACAVAGYLVFTGQIRKMTDIRWYAGIALAIVMILPALAGLYNQFGWEGIRFYFWDNNFGRISGNMVSRNTNFLFYVCNLFYLFIPWVMLLFVSVVLQFRQLFQRRMKPRDWYVFSGIWFLFVLLSASHGKLPNYLFMVIPLFALLIARYVRIALARRDGRLYRTFQGIQNVVAALTGVVVLLLVFWLYPVREIWKMALLASMIFVAVWPFLKTTRKPGRLLIPSLSMVITLNFFINQHVAPQIFSDQAPVKAAAIFNREAMPGEVLGNYNYPSHELFFYSKVPAIQIFNDVELLERMKKPGNWILTNGETVDRNPGLPYPGMEIIPLKHVWINKLSFKYLNPGTRESALDTLYLLRSGHP